MTQAILLAFLTLLVSACMLLGVASLVSYARQKPRYRVAALLAVAVYLVLLVSVVQGWLSTIR